MALVEPASEAGRKDLPAPHKATYPGSPGIPGVPGYDRGPRLHPGFPGIFGVPGTPKVRGHSPNSQNIVAVLCPKLYMLETVRGVTICSLQQAQDRPFVRSSVPVRVHGSDGPPCCTVMVALSFSFS